MSNGNLFQTSGPMKENAELVLDKLGTLGTLRM